MDKRPDGKTLLTWDGLDALIATLVDRIGTKRFDFFLGISRGGLIPTALLAKRLRQFEILTASVMFYDANDKRLPHPVLLQFPPEPILLGKTVLVIDDVWDSGHTLALITKVVRRAGGIPLVATVFFKPEKSEVEGKPDFYAAETNDWVVFPWEPLTEQ